MHTINAFVTAFSLLCGCSMPQVEKDLWRCGPSKYFNGYEPEKPSRDDFGNPVYLRDYYPGQPFRNNKFSKGGGPIKVCTPSIKGAAPARFSYSFPAILF